jgi:hypothetical protein
MLFLIISFCGDRTMAKQKTVTHLPAPSTPRLAAQLFTAMGELVMIAVCVVGIVTIVGRVVAGAELKSRERLRSSPPRWEVCRFDRQFGEMCAPADPPPPVRWHYARELY